MWTRTHTSIGWGSSINIIKNSIKLYWLGWRRMPRITMHASTIEIIAIGCKWRIVYLLADHYLSLFRVYMFTYCGINGFPFSRPHSIGTMIFSEIFCSLFVYMMINLMHNAVCGWIPSWVIFDAVSSENSFSRIIQLSCRFFKKSHDWPMSLAYSELLNLTFTMAHDWLRELYQWRNRWP